LTASASRRLPHCRQEGQRLLKGHACSASSSRSPQQTINQVLRGDSVLVSHNVDLVDDVNQLIGLESPLSHNTDKALRGLFSIKLCCVQGQQTSPRKLQTFGHVIAGLCPPKGDVLHFLECEAKLLSKPEEGSTHLLNRKERVFHNARQRNHPHLHVGYVGDNLAQTSGKAKH